MTPEVPTDDEVQQADLVLLRLLVRQGCHKINNRIMEVESQLALALGELTRPDALESRIHAARRALKDLGGDVSVIHAQARAADSQVDHFSLETLLDELRPYLVSASIDRPAWHIADSDDWGRYVAGSRRQWQRSLLLLSESWLANLRRGAGSPRLGLAAEGEGVAICMEGDVDRGALESDGLFRVGLHQAWELGFEAGLDGEPEAGCRLSLGVPGAA